MVLPNEYAGYYPEEEEETIIDIAKPNDSGAMPAANYNIAGPLADHKPNTAMKDAMASAGANVAGNVGQAGLMGGGPEGTFFEKGLWGLGGGAGSATMPAAAGANVAATAGNVANAATIANAAGASGAAGAGAAGLGGGMMAALASNPVGWAIGAGLLAKKFGLFNKGGGVGPLSPQYKEGGGYSTISAMPKDQQGGLGKALDTYGPVSWLHRLMGHTTQRPNKGVMRGAEAFGVGPLSDNKSAIKMEKKETIEYKN